MKKITLLVVLAAGLLVVLGVSAQETKPSGGPATGAADPLKLFPDEILAKGNGFEIRRSRLDEAFIELRSSLATRGQTMPEDQRDSFEARLLNDMIFNRILAGKATEADKTKAKETADQFIADAKAKAVSEELFHRRLRLNNLTMEQFEKRVYEDVLPRAVLAREIRSQVALRDEQVKKYYDENPAKFEDPEMVRVRHILLSTRDGSTGQELSDSQRQARRKEMEAILKRARAGADFTALATDLSEDPNSRAKGGEVVLPRGQLPTAFAEFEVAAFALDTNRISDIVTTPQGFHIIKLMERIPARTVPFSEAGPRIRDLLVQQEGQKLLPDYVEKLKREAGVEILDKKLKDRMAALLEAAKAQRP